MIKIVTLRRNKNYFKLKDQCGFSNDQKWLLSWLKSVKYVIGKFWYKFW